MTPQKIIVIGASAGGVEATSRLLRLLPPNFPASIFIVLHIPAHSRSFLPEIFGRASSLPVVHPKDMEAIETGKIYVAPPDYHLLIRRNHIQLSKGPKVNNSRPSIDNLFISAALAYGTDVIAVVLTGMLDDGSLGLAKIKRYGGIAIVQDPTEATYPSMPLNAIHKTKVDYVLKLSAISEQLTKLAEEPNEQQVITMNEQEFDEESNLEKLPREDDLQNGEEAYKRGKASIFSCPECSGVLAEINDEGMLRFVCRVGHAYSAEWLAATQEENVEKALWIALRSLEEGASFSRDMAGHGIDATAQYLEKAKEYERQAEVLRSLLLKQG